MKEQLHKILAEIDQLKTAERIELMDEDPNPDTLLAISHRLRALDAAATYRMAVGA